jgi:hypothetical protein
MVLALLFAGILCGGGRPGGRHSVRRAGERRGEHGCAQEAETLAGQDLAVGTLCAERGSGGREGYRQWGIKKGCPEKHRAARGN